MLFRCWTNKDAILFRARLKQARHPWTEDLRRIHPGLEGTQESSHRDNPDFRLRGRISAMGPGLPNPEAYAGATVARTDEEWSFRGCRPELALLEGLCSSRRHIELQHRSHELPPTGKKRDCSAKRRHIDVVNSLATFDLIKTFALGVGRDVHGSDQQNPQTDHGSGRMISQILDGQDFTKVHSHGL